MIVYSFIILKWHIPIFECIHCFNLKLNEICSNTCTSCMSAKNAKSYMVYFKPDHDRENVSFSCNVKLMENEIKVSKGVIVTLIGNNTLYCCVWNTLKYIIHISIYKSYWPGIIWIKFIFALSIVWAQN